MSWGTYPELSVASARRIAIQPRELPAQDIDPKVQRDTLNERQLLSFRYDAKPGPVYVCGPKPDRRIESSGAEADGNLRQPKYECQRR